MRKITLINPAQHTRYPQPPIGLAIIAAVLEKQGYRVSLLDANALGLEPDDMLVQVVDTDVIGLTAFTPTVGAAIAIGGRLKRFKPELTVILGGVHATLLPGETLARAPDIDIIVRGEGEDTIVELLRALEQNTPLEDIAGISFRRGENVVNTAPRAGTVDIESLPFPAYHLLPLHQYRPHPPHGREMPFAAIITSRGCPYRCAYCSKPVFGNKYRAQSPERVVAEIAFLKDSFGIRELAFYDDVFTLNERRTHEIAEGMIQRGFHLPWTCETRVNLVNKEMLQHLRQAGCYAIAYGIESASPRILNTLHKDITIAQVEKAVSTSREAGLRTIGYMMIGSPGETPDTIRKTIQFARQLKLDFAQFSITTPFPGTELYELYLQQGNPPVPWEDMVYSGADRQLTPLFTSPQLDREALKQWTRRAYREFYLRTEYVLQRLSQIKSPKDLWLNIKGFFMLLRSIIPSRGKTSA